jgi:hypothetical protein
MSKIEPLIHPDNIFDPEATAALGAAYELAIGEVHAGSRPEFVREIIAKGILAAAMRGDRDPGRLCNSALVAIRNGGRDEGHFAA